MPSPSALLDAELLAEVYLELVGGKQAALDLSARRMRIEGGKAGGDKILSRPRPLPVNLVDAESNAHQAFVEELGEDAVWRQYQ
jgi:DNA polymerase-3 subunit epsilon